MVNLRVVDIYHGDRVSSFRCPVRPDVGADQPARAADHAGLELKKRRIVGQPIGIELGGMVAPTELQ
jgi:hypothetical protein